MSTRKVVEDITLLLDIFYYILLDILILSRKLPKFCEIEFFSSES